MLLDIFTFSLRWAYYACYWHLVSLELGCSYFRCGWNHNHQCEGRSACLSSVLYVCTSLLRFSLLHTFFLTEVILSLSGWYVSSQIIKHVLNCLAVDRSTKMSCVVAYTFDMNKRYNHRVHILRFALLLISWSYIRQSGLILGCTVWFFHEYQQLSYDILRNWDHSCTVSFFHEYQQLSCWTSKEKTWLYV